MRYLIACMALFAAVCGPSRSTFAIGPESPEVKQAIDQAIEYLRTADDGRLGAKSLVGLAFLKAGVDPSDPKIQDALNVVRGATKVGAEGFHHDIYSTGVAIMFLAALDPSKYRPEIEVLAHSLHLRVKKPGSWGYPADNMTHGKTCDTSMTQYGVLGLWEASDLAGVSTPAKVWDRVAFWLITTQAPDGAWGYQGSPSGTLDNRIKQDGVSDRMTVAALGALYIVRNQLGYGEIRKRIDDDTPDALRPVETQDDRKERIKTEIDLKYFQRAMVSGNQHFEKVYKRKQDAWPHYYLYALERFQSLKEADMQVRPKNPGWYQDGAKFLVETQNGDGSWDKENQGGPVPNTCFGILFLVRSTQKSLDKARIYRYQAGVMVGGSGFPESKDVRVRNGAVVVKPLAAPLEKVLEILDNPQHEQYAAAREALADQAHSGDADLLTKHAAELARLARRGETSIRVAAAEALGRSRNLDYTPVLIQLLMDDDMDVVAAAENALVLISRKADGATLGIKPSDSERQVAQRRWSEWFATIRPDLAAGTTR